MLLSLHKIASARGDGLHPRLRELMEERARIDDDPQVVNLDATRGETTSGPLPKGRAAAFLPGNVVSFAARGCREVASDPRSIADKAAQE